MQSPSMHRALDWLKRLWTPDKKPFQFRGKNVMVVGLDSVSLPVALEFARQGAHLIVCDSDSAQLHRAFHELAKRATRVFAVAGNLNTPEAVGRVAESVRAQWGEIDVLVVNPPRAAEGWDHWVPRFRTAINAMRIVIPRMRQSKLGRVIFLGLFDVLSRRLRQKLASQPVAFTNVVVKTATDHGNLTTTNARAKWMARQIVEACRRKEMELVLSMQAVASDALSSRETQLGFQAPTVRCSVPVCLN